MSPAGAAEVVAEAPVLPDETWLACRVLTDQEERGAHAQSLQDVQVRRGHCVGPIIECERDALASVIALAARAEERTRQRETDDLTRRPRSGAHEPGRHRGKRSVPRPVRGHLRRRWRKRHAARGSRNRQAASLSRRRTGRLPNATLI